MFYNLFSTHDKFHNTDLCTLFYRKFYLDAPPKKSRDKNRGSPKSKYQNQIVQSERNFSWTLGTFSRLQTFKYVLFIGDTLNAFLLTPDKSQAFAGVLQVE